MTRRDLLMAGVGFAAGIRTRRHVIVIGAGVAGLAAAQQLQAEGVRVTVLESRERIGGRILTDRSSGHPIEMGAAWVHGAANQNPIVPRLRQAGRTLVTPPETIGILTDKGFASAKDTDRAWSEYEAWRDGLEDHPQGSLADALRRRPLSTLARVFVNAELEFDGGAPAARLAVRSLLEGQAMPGGDRLVRGGYDGLVNSLAQGLTIRRNAEVVSVFCGEPEAVVTLKNMERLTADAVICTLPVGVLKTMVGSFFGPGANPLTRMKGLEMGHVERIVGVWDDPWWPADVSIWAISPTPAREISLVMDLRQALGPGSVTMLAGFWLGEAARPPLRTQQEAAAQFTATLRRLFGHNPPAPRWMRASQWGLERGSLGAYSHLTPDAPADIRTRWSRLWGRLAWAGEHTSVDYPATVHGALLSGQRAADAIRKSIL